MDLHAVAFAILWRTCGSPTRTSVTLKNEQGVLTAGTIMPSCKHYPQRKSVRACQMWPIQIPVLGIVQGQLCTICKNRAPHVNFCHPVVLKSYGSKVSKKIGWHFFKPGSRSFQGHIISNV